MLNTGVGSAYNVLDVFERGSTELVAVVDMLHMLAYAQHRGWGGSYNVLDASETGSAELGVDRVHGCPHPPCPPSLEP